MIGLETRMKEDRIYERYIGKKGGAIARTVSMIKEVLSNEIEGYKMNSIQYPKRRLFLKWGLEFATRITVRLGIVKLLRFPYVAYTHMADIPYIKKNIEKYKKE